MDKFATLEPVRLYNAPTPSTPSGSAPSSNRFSFHKPAALPVSSHSRTKSYAPFQLIGRLPVDLHITVLTHLAVPDIPARHRRAQDGDHSRLRTYVASRAHVQRRLSVVCVSLGMSGMYHLVRPSSSRNPHVCTHAYAIAGCERLRAVGAGRLHSS